MMFRLLLSDERSAVRRNTAVLFSVVVLATGITSLILMSLGEQTYRDLDRRVLRASQDLASGSPV
jgi:flavin-dependent dehydrogenase